jgi:hypothetical protein
MAQEKSTISRLNEICQQWKFPLPVYREAEGNYQQFGTEVTLTLEDDVLGFHALGRTKKISKTNVADKAILYIEENYPHLLKPPPLPVIYHPSVCQTFITYIISGTRTIRFHCSTAFKENSIKQTERGTCQYA